jgi:hypothetical protein
VIDGLVLARMGICASIVGLLLLSVTSARGHSWYEPSCCSGQDCAPVADGVVTENRLGVHVQGFGFLSPSDSRVRWSRDDQDHVCASGGKLLCVYRKPSGM